MSKYPVLSQADSQIMEIIWSKKKVSSSDVLEQVEDTLGWSRQTVRTYLDRLHKKGMLGVEVVSPRVHLYYPKVGREDYAAEMAGTYLNKYFGSISNMMAGLIKKEDVSDEELDNLEQIIRQYRNKK